MLWLPQHLVLFLLSAVMARIAAILLAVSIIQRWYSRDFGNSVRDHRAAVDGGALLLLLLPSPLLLLLPRWLLRQQ